MKVCLVLSLKLRLEPENNVSEFGSRMKCNVTRMFYITVWNSKSSKRLVSLSDLLTFLTVLPCVMAGFPPTESNLNN